MLLTTTEVAKKLGLSRRQVQLRIERGRIPAHWVAGRALVDPADLEPQAATAATATPESPAPPPPDAPSPLSAATLEPFQQGLALLRDPAHPLPETATVPLRGALIGLVRGLHAPITEQRLDEWRRSRALVVEAVAAAWLDGAAGGAALEARVLPYSWRATFVRTLPNHPNGAAGRMPPHSPGWHQPVIN